MSVTQTAARQLPFRFRENPVPYPFPIPNRSLNIYCTIPAEKLQDVFMLFLHCGGVFLLTEKFFRKSLAFLIKMWYNLFCAEDWHGWCAVITGFGYETRMTRNVTDFVNIECTKARVFVDYLWRKCLHLASKCIHFSWILDVSISPSALQKPCKIQTQSNTERYRSGHNGADSKSVWAKAREGSNPSLSAKRPQFSRIAVLNFYIVGAL